jgi:hypothetical protein
MDSDKRLAGWCSLPPGDTKPGCVARVSDSASSLRRTAHTELKKIYPYTIPGRSSAHWPVTQANLGVRLCVGGEETGVPLADLNQILRYMCLLLWFPRDSLDNSPPPPGGSPGALALRIVHFDVFLEISVLPLRSRPPFTLHILKDVLHCARSLWPLLRADGTEGQQLRGHSANFHG